MQPAGGIPLNEGRAPVGDGEVADREQHLGHTQAQSTPGAQGVEQDVGGHPDAQECADVDAEVPDESEHGRVLPSGDALMGRTHLGGMPGSSCRLLERAA